MEWKPRWAFFSYMWTAFYVPPGEGEKKRGKKGREKRREEKKEEKGSRITNHDGPSSRGQVACKRTRKKNNYTIIIITILCWKVLACATTCPSPLTCCKISTTILHTCTASPRLTKLGILPLLTSLTFAGWGEGYFTDHTICNYAVSIDPIPWMLLEVSLSSLLLNICSCCCCRCRSRWCFCG